jgi:alanine racemase
MDVLNRLVKGGLMMQYQQDRTWLEVDLDAIGKNYVDIKKKIAPDCQIIAVVKANAYGLGAVRIARELEALGCPMFSVACLQEAIELRENGISVPILLSGVLNPMHVELAIDNDIEVALVSYHHAKSLSKSAKTSGQRIKGHIKLDVGLSRLGIVVKNRRSEALSEILKIAELDCIDPVAIFTHITSAKLPGAEEFDRGQLELFAQMAIKVYEVGLRLKKHCCSTIPAVRYPEYNFDYIRVAAILFGQLPHTYERFNIKPVVELKTRIWQIKHVEAGTAISYGPIFHTLRRTKMAVVPIGFADGLRRSISNRGSMLIHGKMAPIIGTLSSDYSVLDMTDIPEAKEGDIVTVFGCDNGIEQPEHVYADLYPGTVSEVTSAISSRVPRFYLKGGAIA